MSHTRAMGEVLSWLGGLKQICSGTHQEVTKDNTAHKNPLANGEVNDYTICQLLCLALGEDVVGPLFGR